MRSVFMWLDIRACQDSDGDGIGDIPGLIRRLDHLAETGIGALLFPGLFATDFAYGGTMVTDFNTVEPTFGSWDDFDRLVVEAHDRGIALLPGWMPFSTHPDHLAFQASRDTNHPDHATYRNYYLWRDDVNSRLPRRFGHWEWDEGRGAYYHAVWMTMDGRWCPEVDLTDPVAREKNLGAVRSLLDRGVDGFWVDCGVWGGFTNEADHVEWSRSFTDLVHSYPNRWIISEGSKSIADTIVRDGYDSYFADQSRRVPIAKLAFRKPHQSTLVELFDQMESHGVHEALFSTYDDEHGHQVMSALDLPRTIHPEESESTARAKIAFLLHATLPLVPLITFPQHLGLVREKGMELVAARPPLAVWDTTSHFGFSASEPFLPHLDSDVPAGISVAEQGAEDDSLLSFVAALYALRSDFQALWSGDVATTYAKVPTSNERDCFAYVRVDPAGSRPALIVVNLANATETVVLYPDTSATASAMIGERSKAVVRLSIEPMKETASIDGGALSLELNGPSAAILELF